MFRFMCGRKPGRITQDITLTLVHKALDKSEGLLDDGLEQGQKYFNHAETLYHNWCLQTGKSDYEVSRKLDDLWVCFMYKIETIITP